MVSCSSIGYSGTPLGRSVSEQLQLRMYTHLIYGSLFFFIHRYYRSSDAILLVFDISDPNTFKNLEVIIVVGLSPISARHVLFFCIVLVLFWLLL